MQEKNVKEALIECKDISSDIMDNIGLLLTSEGIEYTHSSESEIIVNEKSKSEIKDILSKMENISKQQLKLILQITDVNGTTFIRQKFN